MPLALFITDGPALGYWAQHHVKLWTYVYQIMLKHFIIYYTIMWLFCSVLWLIYRMNLGGCFMKKEGQTPQWCYFLFFIFFKHRLMQFTTRQRSNSFSPITIISQTRTHSNENFISFTPAKVNNRKKLLWFRTRLENNSMSLKVS